MYAPSCLSRRGKGVDGLPGMGSGVYEARAFLIVASILGDVRCIPMIHGFMQHHWRTQKSLRPYVEELPKNTYAIFSKGSGLII